MTNNELNKLKELAERAAPGPWVNAYKLTPMVDHVWSLGKEELIAKDLEENNAEYIAAVSPDVVLKLIAHISSLDEEVKSLRAENERLKGARTCPACFQTIARDQDIEVVLSLQSQLAEAREVIEMATFHHNACPWLRGEGCVCANEKARAYLEKYK